GAIMDFLAVFAPDWIGSMFFFGDHDRFEFHLLDDARRLVEKRTFFIRIRASLRLPSSYVILYENM
ncbi:MAG: hypothetical protein U9Q07_11890, partial [Planctomycetota bacterium]|nr:hypothetical protein [Planctomycetota bacterium]